MNADLLLRLVATPSLIGVASLAGRRWGPMVSGWLVGLPFTSGPVALFLALDHGVSFAASAALGTLAGATSQVAFCLAYGWAARRSIFSPRPLSRGGKEPGERAWPAALVAGCLAFALATLLLRDLTLPAVALFLLTCAMLCVGLVLMPRPVARSGPVAGAWPWWDLPLRMALATSVVLLLTTTATTLGPRLTGLLTPFPLYAMVLAIFAHRAQGAGAAIAVLRGLLLGLFAFASFFLALALLLPTAGIAAAFALACAAALLAQAGTLWAAQRPGAARSS